MRTSELSNGIGVLSFSLPRYGTIVVAVSCSAISFNGDSTVVSGSPGERVIAMTSSIVALEAFQEEPDEFDIVITDQIMPNLIGTQLAQELINIRSDIPVILCCGFEENVNPGS